VNTRCWRPCAVRPTSTKTNRPKSSKATTTPTRQKSDAHHPEAVAWGSCKPPPVVPPFVAPGRAVLVAAGIADAVAGAVGLGTVVTVGRGVGVALGMVVGVAVGRGGGLNGAAETAEVGNSNSDTTKARIISRVTPAGSATLQRSCPCRKRAADAHRANRFIRVFLCPQEQTVCHADIRHSLTFMKNWSSGPAGIYSAPVSRRRDPARER
jgi:hypothetical protein